MKQYELTVLIHPDLEMNLAPATDKITKLIADSGGKITKEVSEGKKRLAYSIQGQEFAVYNYYELDLPTEGPGKISSVLNITDEVIRYLLVRADERKAKMEAARAEAEAEEATADEAAAAEADSAADKTEAETDKDDAKADKDAKVEEDKEEE